MNNQKIKNIELIKNNRTWNILDVLEDKLYVNLNTDFRKYLYSLLKSRNILHKDLANNLKIPRSQVSKNLSGKQDFRYKHLLYICNLLDISKSQAVNNIKSISLKNYKEKSHNLKFNITFDQYLVRIIGHICGDGSLRANHNIGYTNKEQNLINDFILSFQKSFGRIPYCRYLSLDGTTNLGFPRITGLFLSRVFPKIEQNTIPMQHLLANKCLIPQFLGAIFDDEGHVSVRSKGLEIMLSQKNVLNNIRILFEAIGITCSNIKKKNNSQWDPMHRFSIYRRKNIRKFYQIINLNHPKKKKLLRDLLNSYSKKYVDYELREKILNELQTSSKTSSDLVKLSDAPLSSICKCLTKLEKEGGTIKEKVYRKGYKKKRYMTNLWSLK